MSKTINKLDGLILFDEKDADTIMNHSWSIDSEGYPTTGTKMNNKWVSVRMHKLLLDTPKGFFTDHINGNKLDNRRSNLRIVEPSMNLRNHSGFKRGKATSKYRGVHWSTSNNGWVAQITYHRKITCLGTHKTPEEAARAYDKASYEMFGKDGWFNFPQEVRELTGEKEWHGSVV